MQYRETRRRSLAKTATWRIIAALITFSTVSLLSSSETLALSVTIMREAIAFVSLYFHERAWDAIEWGRAVKPSGE